MKQDLSYSKYREEIQKLAFQKEKILKLANEKTEEIGRASCRERV